jgi:hypothetical protein
VRRDRRGMRGKYYSSHGRQNTATVLQGCGEDGLLSGIWTTAGSREAITLVECRRPLGKVKKGLCGGAFRSRESPRQDARLPDRTGRLLPPSMRLTTLFPLFTDKRGNHMKNPLDSLWGTVIAGVVLTAVLYYVVKSLIGG